MSLPASIERQLKNGFGFDPARSEHHFVVTIPSSAAEKVLISEHITWSESVGSSAPHTNSRRLDGQSRVELSREKWNAIAEQARVLFNARLRKEGLTAGGWMGGNNLLRRELGRELCVLVWAIEDADPSHIERASKNWGGFTPEERWWLYTQTAATTPMLGDRGRGWRLALRYALAESEEGGSRDYIDVRSDYADPPITLEARPTIQDSATYTSLNASQPTMLEAAGSQAYPAPVKTKISKKKGKKDA